MCAESPAVSIVIATRDRRGSLLSSLDRLAALPGRPPLVVVDNGSVDGTPAAVRAAHPQVTVIEAGSNLGAAARTVGVRALDTPLAAFADDDSWWRPGALARAAERFAADGALGLLAARVLVGDEQRLDPVCEAMERGPERVLGFVACGAVVRRSAFLEVGGFDPRYGIGGEERRLALDLAAAGWTSIYVPNVVAHHHPDAGGLPRPGRLRRQVRNDLWSAWLRRPVSSALRETARALRGARPRAAALGAADALRGAAWVMRERKPVPVGVELLAREIERSGE